MAIVKCPNDHFYDDLKYGKCPVCAGEAFPEVDSFNSQKTEYLRISSEDSPTQFYDETAQEDDKTIMLQEGILQNLKTAGWLVCMNGTAEGRSIPFHIGQNFAGRAPDMDIVLTDDPMISRNRHFSVVYEPKTIRFFLCAGNGSTYLNSALVRVSEELHDGDVITAGQTDYAFVPYCRKGRTWDE